MMRTAEVSIVMSVYNGEQYVHEAVESIMGQTFNDFEFIIINDGSTDKTSQILNSFVKKDTRINLIEQPNKGLVPSLNRGIKVAKGIYIARQDADDRSEPNRLSKQVGFLNKYPETVVIGSNISVMDSQGKIMHRHAVLLNDPELRQELLIRSPFAHGSVVFKRQAAVEAGMYDEAMWPAEDYDLWLRLSQYGMLANLDEPLYVYREHDSSISNQMSSLQQTKTDEVQIKAWRRRQRLLPKHKMNINVYKNLEMGQSRIERILDNYLLIARRALVTGQGNLAVKDLLDLATHRIIYRKIAGKIKRRVKK